MSTEIRHAELLLHEAGHWSPSDEQISRVVASEHQVRDAGRIAACESMMGPCALKPDQADGLVTWRQYTDGMPEYHGYAQGKLCFTMRSNHVFDASSYKPAYWTLMYHVGINSRELVECCGDSFPDAEHALERAASRARSTTSVALFWRGCRAATP